MDFSFTSEQDQLRDTVAKLVSQKYDFDTRRKVAKSEAGWRPEMWSQFAELGLLGASFTEAEGGFGSGPIEAMIISEEFGKGLVIEPYLQTVVIGGNFFRHGGTDAQKEEHIAGIIGGETRFAFAYSEPKSRFDLNDISTTAKKDGASYTLNGHKAVVIGAPFATHLIVTARTSGAQRDANG
ncbi:MAG: acyl-CoA/acyl-ACP dehydrogenase, partial [Hyphomonadaceae bacterium]|nr:acyl-CoA/acyl-ACP dehydrogenase [Hyphomonadaceae bacterium]